MNSKLWFAEYEAKERAIAHRLAPRAVTNGFVTRAQAIYGDKIHSKRLAFHRPGAPLAPLLFLYQQVVVFVPPSSIARIEARLGLSWEVFLRLAERGCIIPIIGHPLHYAEFDYFRRLFELSPASVWARGDELALEFAGGRDYWNTVNQIARVEEFVYEPAIRAKFQNQFPHASEVQLVRLIEAEVKTNYVDLCMFGYEPLANSLIEENGGFGARRLLELSELITYPSLMGLGGTPNYGLHGQRAAEMVAAAPTLEYPPHEVPPEAEILIHGLALTTPTYADPEIVISFHEDNMSNVLWGALESLELEVATKLNDQEDLFQRAILAQSLLMDVLKEVNGAGYRINRSKVKRHARNSVDLTLKLGAVAPIATAASAWIGQDWLEAGITALEVAGYALAVRNYDRAVDSIERRIADFFAGRKLPAMAAQIWWLSEWTQRRGLGPSKSGSV